MPEENNIITSKKAPKAIGAYSQGVVHGDVIYFSGVLGINPEVSKLQIGFDQQLDQIMKNIDYLLESKNLKRENIIKTTIFLKDLAEFPKVNATYEKYFQKPYPARSCIEASKLPLDADVEIEVIAGL